MKKAICMLLAAVLLLTLCACGGKSTALPGTGMPGETASFSWSEYDALIESAKKETDLQKRVQTYRQAEELLLKTGASIPLYHTKKKYLLKPGTAGVYLSLSNSLYFDRIRREGASDDQPLQIAVCGEPASLDCTIKMAADIATLTANTSAGLMRENEEGQYVCDLAERYETSEDGLTYTFRLKPDLKWSDGSPLTAEDFAYSWKRTAAKETASEAGYLFDCIRGYPEDLDLTVSDDGLTLTVVLAQPCAYFLSLCAKAYLMPVNQKQVESAKGYRDAAGKVVNPGAWASAGNIITCGAYTIEEWKHNESIILRKNPYYHDAQSVTTQTIHLMLTADAAAAYNAYAADAVVLTSLIPGDLIKSLQESPEYHTKSLLNTTFLSFNTKSSLFAGMTAEEAATFRRAIGFAIDRAFLCITACNGNAEIAVSAVPPGTSDGGGKTYGEGCEYAEEDGYYGAFSDPDKAREMLKSIGFEFGSDGKLKDPITVDYLFSGAGGAGTNTPVAACLQADLAQLGIRLNLSQREWGVFLGERRNPSTQAFNNSWNADFDDPYGMLSIFTTNSANNDCGLGK